MTCAIAAYQCARLRLAVNAVFMQRERELKRSNKMGCPRQHFITDLIRFIVSLIEENNKIILAADANEHVENGKLARELKRIRLVNLCVKKFHQSGPASYVSRSNLIEKT